MCTYTQAYNGYRRVYHADRCAPQKDPELLTEALSAQSRQLKEPVAEVPLASQTLRCSVQRSGTRRRSEKHLIASRALEARVWFQHCSVH